MKKKKREEREEAHKPQAAPSFRPFEGKLKELAQKAKAEEQAKRETERKAPPPAPRPKTLTREEQRDLDAMSKAGPREDEFFFRRLMSGVRPLDDDHRGRVTNAAEVKRRAPSPAAMEAARRADDEARDRLMSLVEGATRFEVSDDGKRLEGHRLDLDHATWRRVRRGELPIDARMDLHGKGTEEARASLEDFLAQKRARRDRLVLVIHGRGEHSPAGVGVLRGEIAAWLSQGRASQHVAAFATARPDDGGEGALYVLLRA